MFVLTVDALDDFSSNLLWCNSSTGMALIIFKSNKQSCFAMTFGSAIKKSNWLPFSGSNVGNAVTNVLMLDLLDYIKLISLI
jgi:hypothetical protein